MYLNVHIFKISDTYPFAMYLLLKKKYISNGNKKKKKNYGRGAGKPNEAHYKIPPPSAASAN